MGRSVWCSGASGAREASPLESPHPTRSMDSAGFQSTYDNFGLIGRGTYGSVYRALDASGQPVAIKCVPLDPNDSEQTSAQAQHEIDLLRSCDSPQVLRYSAAHRDAAECLWIVTELCEGGFVDGIVGELFFRFSLYHSTTALRYT